MAKETISTTQQKITDSDFVLEFRTYDWLTYQEAIEYQHIVAGEQEIKVGKKDKKVTNEDMEFTVTLSQLHEANTYLVKHLCVDLPYEKFDELKTEVRDQVIQIVQDIQNKVEKK